MFLFKAKMILRGYLYHQLENASTKNNNTETFNQFKFIKKTSFYLNISLPLKMVKKGSE